MFWMDLPHYQGRRGRYVATILSSYAPTVKIEAGAIIETLQLNSINKTTKLTIDDAANITKIIYKGVEYSTIADFKAAL